MSAPYTNTSNRIWIIDASMSPPDRPLCFCPLEDDAVIIGINFISDKPPNEEMCVGAWHPDGQEVAEQWAAENTNRIKHLFGGAA